MLPERTIDWALHRHPIADLTSQRRVLSLSWFVCATAPGVHAGPADLPAELPWDPAEKLGPVAQLLRDNQQWSLDSPPRRFDEQDWWYRLSFEVDNLSPDGWTTLGFDGLATVAEVWLNGAPILSSQDMFLRHEVEVGAQLKLGTNELIMVFRSLDTFLSKRRPRPRWRVPMIENQQLRWARTTILGRTPGWSPPCAVVGPWRDVWIEQVAHCQLGNVRVRTALEGKHGRVYFSGVLRSAPMLKLTRARLVVEHEGEQYDVVIAAPAAGQLSAQLVLEDVHLWWPHTHGKPEIYCVKLALEFDGQLQPMVFNLGQVGFRTVKVDQSDGAFAIRVNGTPVFCRGACWTPLDPVTLVGDQPAYRAAVAQLVDAGMNMVRVGGTMVYEADAFYDECDRQGVMVWQDFMFASMDFPEDEAFVDMVRAEAQQQLRRWQGRPSLTVLCGNSEVEQQAAMWGATRDRWAPALFHRVLAQASREWCPDVHYWPSSAHGGSFPHQADTGTTSYYGVGAYLRHFDDARRSNVKFATECLAFANVPEASALAAMPGGDGLRVTHAGWKARAPRDLGAGWDFEDVRDHYLAQLFSVDPMRLRYTDHDRYLLLSRITTGEVMAAVFQDWRRSGSSCNGALIWFLRDLWPGAGWGVIDSLGRPKAAYYALKRTLQPIALGLTDEGGNGLYAHLTNEREQSFAAHLQVNAYRAGGVSVGQGSIPVAVGAHDEHSVPLASCFDWFTDLNWAYRFGPPVAQVVMASLVAPDGQVLSRAWHFPQGLSLPRESDVGLSAWASCDEQGNWILVVSTRSFAQYVQLDLKGYIPDDAYFHLAPGDTRKVILKAEPGVRCAVSGSVSALNSEAVAIVQVGTDPKNMV